MSSTLLKPSLLLSPLSLITPLLLLLLALQITATEYCQCENPDYGHTFGGIQHKCNALTNKDWCSTNCDFFGGNCDYCQFQPAGHGPSADYDQLKSWCFAQTEWDAAKQRYFKGSQVFCYSAKNARPKKFGNKGCEHQDNGDLPRDRTAFLRILLEGGWYQRRGCGNLMLTDWSTLADGVRRRNDDCVAVNNSTLHYTITCPYTANDAVNEKRRIDFKDYCERAKGHWYLRDNGPDLFTGAEMAQRPLVAVAAAAPDAGTAPAAMPGRYPPQLPSSASSSASWLERGHRVEDGSVDQAGLHQSEHVKGDDDAKGIVHGSGGVSSEGGRKTVVFKEVEDDVTITFVAEDL